MTPLKCTGVYAKWVSPDKTLLMRLGLISQNGSVHKELDMKAEDFIGMTKKGSQNKAEEANLIFRLIRIDSEPFLPYPEDVRDDRLCVEIENGKVVKASIQ